MIKDLTKEYNDELDQKAQKEFELQFKKGDDISVSIIQRKCKVGYNCAYRTLVSLIEQNKIIKNNHIYSVS